ncbi:MAG: hypothetical protein M3367_11170 [Acidobacteriota bacterium]|nr:hypothetical protein [Acidobacteriota bacterium]
MCGDGSASPSVVFQFLRGCAPNGGIAAKVRETHNRKGRTFPHIGGQSPKTRLLAD